MQKVSDLNLQEGIRAEIPLAFARYLESRTDEKVLDVVLVYNGVDRFDTIINPSGLRTDITTVTVDYNHNRVNTGAYITNVRVEKDYVTADGQVIEEALVGEIHVPRDARMFYFDRQTGQKKDNGSLWDAVDKGWVRSVSVDFRPKKQSTNTRTGITTFTEWDLLCLSLLDVTPGQPYSGIKLIRALFNQNNELVMQTEKRSLYGACIGEYVVKEATSEIYKVVKIEALEGSNTMTLEGISNPNGETITLTMNDDEMIEGYDYLSIKHLADHIFMSDTQRQEAPVEEPKEPTLEPVEEPVKTDETEIQITDQERSLQRQLELQKQLNEALKEQLELKRALEETKTENTPITPAPTSESKSPEELEDEEKAKKLEEYSRKLTDPVKSGSETSSTQFPDGDEEVVETKKEQKRSIGEAIYNSYTLKQLQ